MKKLIILIMFIYCYCSYAECNNETDINKCNSIKIEYNNFYCFKAKFYNNDDLKCMSFQRILKIKKFFGSLCLDLEKKFFQNIVFTY